MHLPFYLARVPAGFPSPADDHLDSRIDLTEYLVRNPAATFLSRTQGPSMRGAGIRDGSTLVVDRSLEAHDGDIVVAALYGELTVKYLRKERGRAWLVSAHPDYPPIELSEHMEAHVWGVVCHAINHYR